MNFSSPPLIKLRPVQIPKLPTMPNSMFARPAAPTHRWSDTTQSSSSSSSSSSGAIYTSQLHCCPHNTTNANAWKKQKIDHDEVSDEIKRRREVRFVPDFEINNTNNRILYMIAQFLVKNNIYRNINLGKDGVHYFSSGEVDDINKYLNITTNEIVIHGYAYLLMDKHEDDDRNYAGYIMMRGKTHYIKTHFGQIDGKFHMDTKIIQIP
jgi:hypothetical protein